METEALPRLAIGIYRLVFEPENGGPLPVSRLSGSAWRGALGHALKRVACVTGERVCQTCLLYRSCPHAYIFFTPPPPGARKMRRYEAVPHPFALRLGGSTSEPPGCELFLTLFGEGNRHLGLMIYALSRAAAQDRGVGGARLRLRAVHQETIPGSGQWDLIHTPGGKLSVCDPAVIEPPPAPDALRIALQTPLRVKREGRHVRPEEFRFADLFGSLLRRVSMLTYFHGARPVETDFRSLVHSARRIEARADLRWVEMTRYSSRQKTAMKLGGVIGCLEIANQDLTPFWPYLWLGQWTHAGAAATMGFGHYTLASLRVAQSSEPASTIGAYEQA